MNFLKKTLFTAIHSYQVMMATKLEVFAGLTCLAHERLQSGKGRVGLASSPGPLRARPLNPRENKRRESLVRDAILDLPKFGEKL